MIIILNKKYTEKMEEILDELMTFLGILTKFKAFFMIFFIRHNIDL